MAGGSSTKVIQVTNIAPQATKDQMQSLFGNIGKIDEIRLYPTVRDISCPVQSRICYVKYCDSTSVPIAQHLTNTVFIDRALIVIPVTQIPEEYRALEMSKNGTIVPGLQKPDAKLPPEVINRIEGQSPQQVIKTYDPKLIDNHLPEYPALPSHYDSRKIEEIRRTIIVCDVKNEWRLDDLMECFARAGEVKYARWADKPDGKVFCMIEFCEQYSVINALKMQGQEFKGGYLNIYHSTDSIIKPEAKSNEAAQREIEEAMSIVKEAQSMISAAIDPVIGMLAKDKRRHSTSRSRSRERRRSRSKRSRSRRSRSRDRRRSRSRSRKRSRSRSKRSRSRRSRSRDRRRSRSRKRSHSHSKRSRSRRSRSRDRRRSRSRDRRRSRSRDRKRSHRKEEKKIRRTRSRSKRRSSSRSRSSRSKDIVVKSSSTSSTKRRSKSPDLRKLKKIVEESIVRDYDAEEKIGQRSSTEKSRKSASLEKSDNMDISNSP